MKGRRSEVFMLSLRSKISGLKCEALCLRLEV